MYKNNEPVICKKCAHRQFRGTQCDFCGTDLSEKPIEKPKMSEFAKLRILGLVAILVIFFVVLYFVHQFRH
jgi:hypothetical protein